MIALNCSPFWGGWDKKGRYMGNKYIQNVGVIKVLSDVNRMAIVDMLSCEELCVCEILENFRLHLLSQKIWKYSRVNRLNIKKLLINNIK